MQTVLFHETVFGPIHSRRLGISLGINLMPNDGKICSFDCVYCEAGYNAQGQGTTGVPTRNDVHYRLNAKLSAMHAAGEKLDVITFSGNGEPTLHPDFARIALDVAALRDQYFPQARMSLLSNATRIHLEEVRKALLCFDNILLKLDTVSEEYIRRVDRPCGHYSVEEQMKWLTELHERITIQTMFMKGTHEGEDVNNCKEEFIVPWLEALSSIRPRMVTIYTIDRETPSPLLEKASREELDAIGGRVRELGIPCSVSY